MPPDGGILHASTKKNRNSVLVLALLIGNAAAGLASRLARGLALAASAVLCAFAKVLRIQSLNVLHNKILRFSIDMGIISQFEKKVNRQERFFSFFLS